MTEITQDTLIYELILRNEILENKCMNYNIELERIKAENLQLSTNYEQLKNKCAEVTKELDRVEDINMNLSTECETQKRKEVLKNKSLAHVV